MLLAVLVIVGFAFYVMTAEERTRALRPAGTVLCHARRGVELGLAGARVFVLALVERQRWAVAMLAVLVLLIVSAALHAVYMRSFTDVRPEIERVFAIEEETVRAYDRAVGQFKLGAISAEALSNVIGKTVLPELHATRERLKSLQRVPPRLQPVLVTADEYLQLRIDSWRLRAEALEKRSIGALTHADQTERDSLAALRVLTSTELP